MITMTIDVFITVVVCAALAGALAGWFYTEGWHDETDI